MERSLIIVICVAIYMLMCIAVGIWAMRRTKSTSDFFMAGRSLGALVTAVAVFSSTMSGFGFVGGPGLVYRMGMSSIWMVVCTTIGFSLSTFLLATRIRTISELRNSISLPDVVRARYGSDTTAGLTAVAIILGVIGYLASQIKAMAIVFQQVANDWFTESGWDFHLSLGWCVTISCAVLVFYCVTGGIIASVYTDLIQGLMMMVASTMVFVAAMHSVDGGFAGISETLATDNPQSISPWGTIGILGALSFYFLFALGGAGQPHVITKMMMIRNIKDVKTMLPLSIIGYSVTALLWISIGLAVRTLVLQGEIGELGKADDAAASFLQNYTHPILAGLVFAGLFAAIMSTADSFLNIGAAAIVHDIPRSLTGKSLNNELLWARIATLVIAIGAALFSLYSPDKYIALLGAFGWGTFAAAIVPTVAVGFNWKRATPLAANVAIIVSLAINLGVKLFAVEIPYGIHEGAISLLVSLTLFFAISLASPQPKIDDDIAAVMDL